MSGRSHFEVMGVARGYHLEEAELERRYRELQRQHHPDKFAKAPAAERLAALRRTTELNDAYRVLKDAPKRAEYLLKLEGLELSDEKPSGIGDTRVKVDPALLMEMLERNEALAEARAAGDAAEVARLAAAVRSEREQALRAIDEGFRALESGDRASLQRIGQALVSLRYHARFLEQVAAFEEGAQKGLD